MRVRIVPNRGGNEEREMIMSIEEYIPDHCTHCRDNCPSGIYPDGDRDHESKLFPGVNVVGPNHFPILWADDSCPMCAAINEEREMK